jgi:hypothetical protein
MTLIPDVGAALGQTIFGGGNNSFTDPNRVPMIFTSLQRLRSTGLDTSFRITTVGSSLTNDIVEFSKLNSGVQVAIEMAVNPNSISFKQPKRIVKRDTQEGSVFFHFSNSKGENNDILTMDFRGNTGNIDLRGDITTQTSVFATQSGSNTLAAKKLAIWQNLWALTREPMLLSDGTQNEFLIIYSSVGIPIQISLIGHYNNVLEFSEVADKPFTRDYSMSFTVQEVVPPLEELPGLVQTQVIDTRGAGAV